jgi:hypothetical protein
VRDVCNGMLFNTDTVLEGKKCCIPAGSFPIDTVGMYLMSYYVTEFRIMYNSSDATNTVYRRHPPIYENICGVIPVNMHVSHKQLVCVHGNIAFKVGNAIFKGVRDVHAIKVSGIHVCCAHAMPTPLDHSFDHFVALTPSQHRRLSRRCST